MAFLSTAGGTVIILRGDEDEAVGLGDRGGPPLNDLVLVSRAPRHGWRCWLVKKGHRKVAKVEQPRFDVTTLLEVLENPLRRPF
jgi:hypothetical protein